jgi:hypothetical protein
LVLAVKAVGNCKAGKSQNKLLVKRAEDGGDFFDDHAQTQAALLEFGIQFGIGAWQAFQDAPHVRLMLGKTFGVRMARVSPVA